MANLLNYVLIPNGDTMLEPNPNPGFQLVLHRRLELQPFNVRSPLDPYPVDGQIWPRGQAQA